MTDFLPFSAEQNIEKCKTEIARAEFQFIPSRVEHKHRSTTNHVLREKIRHMSVVNPPWYELEFALYDFWFTVLDRGAMDKRVTPAMKYSLLHQRSSHFTGMNNNAFGIGFETWFAESQNYGHVGDKMNACPKCKDFN